MSDYDEEIDGDGRTRQNRSRIEKFNLLKERINKAKKRYSKGEVTNGRLLIALFKTVTSVVQVLSVVRKQRNQERATKILDFQQTLPLYNEVLKSWLIRTVKTPILTIIRQPDEDMDFVPLDGSYTREATRNARF